MREDAKKRIDSQMPLAEKEKRANTVICTEGTIENTQTQVRALLDHLERRRQA
jgi:dephospho-CoA kinase